MVTSPRWLHCLSQITANFPGVSNSYLRRTIVPSVLSGGGHEHARGTNKSTIYRHGRLGDESIGRLIAHAQSRLSTSKYNKYDGHAPGIPVYSLLSKLYSLNDEPSISYAALSAIF